MSGSETREVKHREKIVFRWAYHAGQTAWFSRDWSSIEVGHRLVRRSVGTSPVCHYSRPIQHVPPTTCHSLSARDVFSVRS